LGHDRLILFSPGLVSFIIQNCNTTRADFHLFFIFIEYHSKTKIHTDAAFQKVIDKTCIVCYDLD
jgi:hypothetical protein